MSQAVNQFSGLIDIHTHILPGLDDGASNWDEALALAGAASEHGTAVLTCTPHYIPGLYQPAPKTIKELAEEFQHRLGRAGIDLTVKPGMEVYLGPDVPELAETGRLLPLGGYFPDQPDGALRPCLLVEFPANEVPRYADQVFFELQVQSLVPVLAHPERNAKVMANPHLLERLVHEQGVLVQVDAGSIVGLFGRKIAKTAELLLRKGWVSFVASDGHSQARPPVLSLAKAKVAQLLGTEAATALFTHNPAKILDGKEVQLPHL
ncbi:MAG: hypothetical protein H5U02_14050 [Clostridia bacterium]|nr:hypothetical protein [Clostridia bacterium]